MDWFTKKERKQGKERTKFLREQEDRRCQDIPSEHRVPIVIDGAPGVPHSRALTSGESAWCDVCGGFYLPHQHE